MAKKHEAEELLREGLYPSAIAQRMGISINTVIPYLQLRVGEGSLRLSDLYFSWPQEKRGVLQQASDSKYPDDRLLASHNLCRNDLKLFQSLRRPSVFYGDMYEYVSGVEIAIHRLVRMHLEREFGSGEMGWWRKGIPTNIRKNCVSRREEDEEPTAEAYAYTTLIDLATVIAKNWSLFRSHVPKEYGASKKLLESHLVRLNRIRNAVMHPVKGRKWSEDDFEFVRRIARLFGTTGDS